MPRTGTLTTRLRQTRSEPITHTTLAYRAEWGQWLTPKIAFGSPEAAVGYAEKHNYLVFKVITTVEQLYEREVVS